MNKKLFSSSYDISLGRWKSKRKKFEERDPQKLVFQKKSFSRYRRSTIFTLLRCTVVPTSKPVSIFNLCQFATFSDVSFSTKRLRYPLRSINKTTFKLILFFFTSRESFDQNLLRVTYEFCVTPVRVAEEDEYIVHDHFLTLRVNYFIFLPFRLKRN